MAPPCGEQGMDRPVCSYLYSNRNPKVAAWERLWLCLKLSGPLACGAYRIIKPRLHSCLSHGSCVWLVVTDNSQEKTPPPNPRHPLQRWCGSFLMFICQSISGKQFLEKLINQDSTSIIPSREKNDKRYKTNFFSGSARPFIGVSVLQMLALCKKDVSEMFSSGFKIETLFPSF